MSKVLKPISFIDPKRRKARLIKDYKRSRPANPPINAYKSSAYHDQYIIYRWVKRFLDKNLKDGLHFRLNGIEYKASKRNMGWKFVSWEPFDIVPEYGLNCGNGFVEILN